MCDRLPTQPTIPIGTPATTAIKIESITREKVCVKSVVILPDQMIAEL